MRVAEYIAQRLSRETDTVFLLAGGGAMFLNDAFSWCDGLRPVFCHHEQSCSIAAEAYARFPEKIGVVNVTTGPGGINAMNGVFGAWTDSIPMIVISGQVKRQTTLRATGMLDKLRQLGDQEVDIISLVKPITKMATFISQVDEIPFALERAIYLAKSGRPGPVWIDIPIDIQSAEIKPEKYFICLDQDAYLHRPEELNTAADRLLKLLKDAQRPIFLIGSGVRLSGALGLLESVAKNLQVPISTSWTAVDAIDHMSELFAERPGVVGSRAGNFVLQNADLVIVIGSRLPIRQVSYNWENFAKDAIRVGVDIDSQELSKPMVDLDLLINADAREFLEALLNRSAEVQTRDRNDWLRKIELIKSDFPALETSHVKRGHPRGRLNPYLFVSDLWKLFTQDEIIAAADASASVIPLQIAPLIGSQRLFTNAGSASMGYELPAAIGASFANPGKRIICLAGDGSIMLNLQELETISRYQLPIKILVLNNEGYLSIKQSQRGFFKREKGSGLTSGLTFPNFNLIAQANKIPFLLISSEQDYGLLQSALNENGPCFIEVKIDPEQSFEPKLGSFQKENGQIESYPLEKMSPLLPDEIQKKYT